jgi:hypothetical protein
MNKDMKLRKFIATTICEYLNENRNINYNIGDTISGREMVNYILDNNLQDSSGLMVYNDAKEIAYASDKWTLEMVSLDKFGWYVDSKYKNESINAYPIILNVGGNFEVLDGKHRIGMYRDMGIKSHPMWVGEL